MNEARPLTRTTRLLIVAFLVFLAVVAVSTVRLAFYGDQQKNEKQQAQAGQAAEQGEKKDLAAEVKKVCDAGGEPAKKLGTLCTKAKEIIQEPTKTVEPALSEEQVKGIVREEVARRNLTLTPEQVNTVATVAASKVPKPKDGKTPTNAQLQPLVSAAVATFCANGACRGKDGADAPPVTAEQLAATLAAYCEPRNDCIGDDGSDGGEGPKGDPGRSVTVSTKDVAEGTEVTFTYSDETPPVVFTIKDGTPGAPGQDAFPFTFKFTVPAALPAEEPTTYICTVANPTDQGSCEEQP